MKYLLNLILLTHLLSFENTMSWREKELTDNLICRLGHKSPTHLLYNQSQLRSIGDKLDHVPPLQFLSYIVTQSDLKISLKLLLNRFITRSPFIDGASKKLINQKNSGQLLHDLQGFSEYIQKDYARIESYYIHNKWPEFLDYLAE